MKKKTLIIILVVVFILSFGFLGAQERPKVALVLSGGGAKGLAHIPIIEEIERLGIPIDMVLGTSMGSLVGGLYSAGYSPRDMRDLIDQNSLIGALAISVVPPLYAPLQTFQKSRENLFSFEFDQGGLGNTPSLIGDQRILNILNNALSRISYNDDFDQLEIPYRAIGTDILTGEKIIFSSGSLVAAIRGSISVPVLFSPYPIGDNYVVDGGLVDNLPIALAREMQADIIIAVDVNASREELSADDVNSVTSMLNQLTVVITKNTVTNQLEHASLVIVPPLSELTMLDFHKVEDILEAGEIAVRANKKELLEIAKIFEELDALDIKDPTRKGSYFELNDVYIASVSHKALDTNIIDFDLKPFFSFVGSPLNDLQKERVTTIFEWVRERGRYATVSYNFTNPIVADDGKIWGNLEVQTRSFEKKRSEVAAGMYGSSSLIFSPREKTKLDFFGDLRLRYTLYSVVDWSVVVANEDAFSVYSSVGKRFAEHWSLSFDMSYITGGIYPTNLRSSFRGVVFRDRAFTSSLSGTWDNQDTALLKIKGNLDYVMFGDPLVNKGGLIPSFSIEALYSSLNYGFFPRQGIRGDFLAVGELTKKLDYRFAVEFQMALELSKKDTVSFKINGSSAIVSQPRSSSYFDYGGIRGIPTYSPTTLVDQMVLLGVDYYHFFKEKPLSIILYSSFKSGFKGNIVSNVVAESTKLPFTNLQSYDISGALALGLSFATTDVLIGVALDNNLKIALFIEVL